MANTFKTKSDGDVLRKCLASFLNHCPFLKTIDSQHDGRFGVEGAKNGGSLLIRNPNEFTVRSGAVMDVQDIEETTQTLTVATQRGIDIDASSYERLMSLDDEADRIIEPAMQRLAAKVQFTILEDVYKKIFNLTGTPATTPATQLAVLNANARLSESLAPDGDRSLLVNSPAMVALANAVGLYLHKGDEISRAFTKGYIGEAAGMKWYESNMVPNHTNGTRDDTTPVCNTSTGITSGSASIITTGADGTMKEGDVFTIADVYAINRETKQRYDRLQQFVVRADHTNDATDTYTVLPVPVTSGAKQNVELVSAGAGKAIVNVAAGGSGAASLVSAQNLAYHRDFCTYVSADMYIQPGLRMVRKTIDNISMRLWVGNDIKNDGFPTRIDVLFGWLVQRPEWAVRVRG